MVGPNQQHTFRQQYHWQVDDHHQRGGAEYGQFRVIIIRRMYDSRVSTATWQYSALTDKSLAHIRINWFAYEDAPPSSIREPGAVTGNARRKTNSSLFRVQRHTSLFNRNLSIYYRARQKPFAYPRKGSPIVCNAKLRTGKLWPMYPYSPKINEEKLVGGCQKSWRKSNLYESFDFASTANNRILLLRNPSSYYLRLACSKLLPRFLHVYVDNPCIAHDNPKWTWRASLPFFWAPTSLSTIQDLDSTRILTRGAINYR